MNPETFFDNFSHLADAPNGIQKLRELILQLAVSGRLGTQNPKDEPASKLLEEIKAEKQKLIEKGKIKKSRELPPVSNTEVPYSLPKSWLWVRLGEITNIVYGKNLPVKNMSPTGFPVFGANGIIGYYERYIYEHEQVLISCRGAYSGKINFSPPKCYITNNSLVLEIGNCFADFKKFLFSALQTSDKSKLVTGSAQPQVTVNNAVELVVPIAPVNEQKRIVTKIKELMALCDELEVQQKKKHETRLYLNNSAIDKLLASQTPKEFTANWQRICDNFGLLYDHPGTVDNLRQAILQLAVQGKLIAQDPKDESGAQVLEKIKAEKKLAHKDVDKLSEQIKVSEVPFSLPKGWIWAKLDDVCTTITDGEHLTPEYADKGVPILSAKHVGERNLEFEDVHYVSEDDAVKSRSRCAPEKGDILVVSRGGGIGRTIISDKGGYCLMGSVLLFKLSKFVLNKFVCYYLRCSVGNDRLRSASASTAQPAIYIAHLKKNFVVPLCSLAEQRRIIEKVEELMALCDQLQTQLKEAQETSAKLTAAAVANLTASA